MLEVIATIGGMIAVLLFLFFMFDGHQWVARLVEGRRQFKLEQLRIKQGQIDPEDDHVKRLGPPESPYHNGSPPQTPNR